MIRKTTLIFLLAVFPALVFAKGSKNQRRFVGGNIQDKIASVNEASEAEVTDLAKAAMEFSINYKELMGDDPDLASLAVAGVTAIPQSYIEGASESERKILSDKFLNIFNIFEDNSVKISVLNKISSSDLDGKNFTSTLNDFIRNGNPASSDMALVKNVIQTLGNIGDEESFKVLFKAIPDQKWELVRGDLELAFRQLLSESELLTLDLIGRGNALEIRTIFDIVAKSEGATKNFTAEIAENVLLRSIYIMGNSSSAGEDLPVLQQEALELLKDLQWTRASSTAVQYFAQAVSEFNNGQITEEAFCTVIKSLPVVSPIGSIQPLSSYLASLNKQMEEKTAAPAENVVLALISALASVGDKNAFDALLGVTYYEYPDKVIAAARDALAKLKW